MQTLDIRYNRSSPRKELSNLYPRIFTFDGIECGSIEGVLQSLRIDQKDQAYCCSLSGFPAMEYGRKNRIGQVLTWKGDRIDRFSNQYSEWLYSLYWEAYTQDSFSKNFLLNTGDTILTHAVGKMSKNETILTEREFCDLLMKIRNDIRLQETEQFSFL